MELRTVHQRPIRADRDRLRQTCTKDKEDNEILIDVVVERLKLGYNQRPQAIARIGRPRVSPDARKATLFLGSIVDKGLRPPKGHENCCGPICMMQNRRGLERRDRRFNGDVEAVQLSDPERAC